MKSPLSVTERFWSKTARIGECLIWQSARDKDGYGLFQRATRTTVRAHRFVYELAHGPAAAALHIRHSCDNPSCVNPRHLIPGTHTENMRDMYARGRNRHGQALKTHCKRGHEFTSENTWRYRGARYCRECGREAGRRKYWAAKHIIGGD